MGSHGCQHIGFGSMCGWVFDYECHLVLLRSTIGVLCSLALIMAAVCDAFVAASSVHAVTICARVGAPGTCRVPSPVLRSKQNHPNDAEHDLEWFNYVRKKGGFDNSYP